MILIETLWLLLYQFVPEGLTVPPWEGIAEVVRRYWVAKLAVYVVPAARSLAGVKIAVTPE